jgi:hypothetical protein
MYGNITSVPCKPRVGMQVVNFKEDKHHNITHIIGMVDDHDDSKLARIKVLHTNDRDITVHNTEHVFIEDQHLKILIVQNEQEKVPLKYSQWNAAILNNEVGTQSVVKYELKDISGTVFAKIIPEKKIHYDEQDVENAFKAARSSIKKKTFGLTHNTWAFKDYESYKQSLTK